MCNGLCKLYILVFVLFSCICTECLLWIVTFSNFFPNFLGMLCNKNAENFRFWKFFFTKKVNLIPATKRSEQITKSFKQILLYMFMFCWYCFYTFTIIEKRTFRTSHNLNKYENIFGFQTLLFLWLLFFLFPFLSFCPTTLVILWLFIHPSRWIYRLVFPPLFTFLSSSISLSINLVSHVFTSSNHLSFHPFFSFSPVSMLPSPFCFCMCFYILKIN